MMSINISHEPSAHQNVKNEPKISVCIPTYNCAETIERCLESVSNQSVKPYEVLIVDGYSKDDTLEKVRKYPKVRVVGFAKGIGKARKILAEHATEDIIAWVDADVVIPSNWLELHLKIHSENKEIMILSGKSPVRTISPKENVSNVSCETKSVHKGGSLTQMACTMKKEVFSLVNYDERFRVGEEWDFMVSAHLKGIQHFYCDGLFAFHIRRRVARKFRVRYIIYGGNDIFFSSKNTVCGT